MPRLIQARIVTPTGDRIEGVIANLTATGVFVRTTEELRFGQSVTVKLLAHTMPGQVLFLSKDPKGVVLSLRPNPDAKTAILTAAPDVEVLAAPDALSPEDIWSEATNANPVAPSMEVLDDVPKLGTDDLQVMEPSTNLDLTPIDMIDGFDDTIPPSDELPRIDDLDLADPPARPADSLPQIDASLLAAASMDDAPSSPTPPVAEAPPVLPPFPDIDMLDPLPHAETDAVVAAPLEPVTSIEPATPIANDTPLPEPATRADAEEETSAEPEVESAEAASVPGTPVLELVESAPAAAPEAEQSLPILDRDGYTVRFASPDAYSVQFKANIEHGGLVVRADALPIGTQRMLALEVPGSAAYTVSARVIYHQAGKLGFMLDSFNIHKARLKQLAAG